MKNKTRARRSRTAENIAAVAQSVEESSGLSIPRRSLGLGIPQTSLHCILLKDLGLRAYKVQLTQELKPVDHQTIDFLREKIPDRVISRRSDSKPQRWSS